MVLFMERNLGQKSKCIIAKTVCLFHNQFLSIPFMSILNVAYHNVQSRNIPFANLQLVHAFFLSHERYVPNRYCPKHK